MALSTDLFADLPLVQADKGQMLQVVINILHNAIKLTLPCGKATVYTNSRRDAVMVSVSDMGIGISKEDLPYIFERFFKADKSRSKAEPG